MTETWDYLTRTVNLVQVLYKGEEEEEIMSNTASHHSANEMFSLHFVGGSN